MQMAGTRLAFVLVLIVAIFLALHATNGVSADGKGNGQGNGNGVGEGNGQGNGNGGEGNGNGIATGNGQGNGKGQGNGNGGQGNGNGGQGNGNGKGNGKGNGNGNGGQGNGKGKGNGNGKENKAVKCHNNKEYPMCDYVQYCPENCPYSCVVDCEICRPVCSCNKGGAVCQDPRFVGGDGITFYFHGRKDRDFCLVSDADLHINAHFIGKRGANMTRDFTWVQSVAVLFGDHTLFLGAPKTATWDDAVDRLDVLVDGLPVHLPTEYGAKWLSSSVTPKVSVVRSSDTNSVEVEVEGLLKITANVVPITEEESRVHRYGITSDDCFAHLDLGFKFYSLTNDVHGVLGQTYREGYVSRVKISSSMPLMGGEHKFATSGLYAPDCKVARFGRAPGAEIVPAIAEPADVKCGSGVSGRGIVCKK